jgi:hypothetical protein
VALEELADDTKGEVAFQIRTPRPKDQSALSARHSASSVEQCRLAQPGSAFDDHEPTTTH